MSIFIIVAIILVMLHFIYDRIILPTIRLHLRNRLFELRDEVRTIMIEENKTEKDEAFMFVQDGICKFLNRLPEITIHLKVQLSHQYENNMELVADTNRRIDLINESGSDKLLKVFHETNIVVEKAFIANTGVWFIYIVPIVLLVSSLKKLSEIAAELVAMPTSDTERLLPIHK